MRIRAAIIIGMAIVCLMWAYFAGCGDNNPTGPDQPKDYPVYFWDYESTHKLLVYHPATRQIDSMDIPYQPRHGVTVSADGKRLYLAEVYSVIVVDTDSLSFIAELPYKPNSPVAVSRDNELVAITGDDLHILSTSDYSVVFSDTDKVHSGRFSADGQTFYCIGPITHSDPGYVYSVDLSDTLHAVTRRVFADGSPTKVIPSVNEDKWFLYLQLPPMFMSAFEVYDVLKDSIIFIDVLMPGSGNIELTPDGRFVFYTNPGTILFGPPPSHSFTIFNVEANVIEAEVSTIGFIDSVTPDYYPVGRMAVTPDSRWLVALDAPCPNELLLFDIEKRQLVDYVEYYNKFFSNLSVQNAR